MPDETEAAYHWQTPVMNLPDLQPWHQLVPGAELTAGEMDATFTLERYLAREEEMFQEVRDRVEAPMAAAGASLVANRYHPDNISSPGRATRDWNRTFEQMPPVIAGGALLIHGLTAERAPRAAHGRRSPDGAGRLLERRRAGVTLRA